MLINFLFWLFQFCLIIFWLFWIILLDISVMFFNVFFFVFKNVPCYLGFLVDFNILVPLFVLVVSIVFVVWLWTFEIGLKIMPNQALYTDSRILDWEKDYDDLIEEKKFKEQEELQKSFIKKFFDVIVKLWSFFLIFLVPFSFEKKVFWDIYYLKYKCNIPLFKFISVKGFFRNLKQQIVIFFSMWKYSFKQYENNCKNISCDEFLASDAVSLDYWYRISIKKIKNFALSIFCFNFLYLFFLFLIEEKNIDEGYHFIHKLGSFKFYYHLDFLIGVDSISMLMVLLTAFTFIIAISLINYYFIIDLEKKTYEFIIILFMLELFLFLLFFSINIFFFFFFFECLLFPLFLFINIWGSLGNRKHHASFQLFFFTAFGSIFFLAAIFILYANFKILDIRFLILEHLDFNLQCLIFVLMLIGFAVKIPMIPFYSWLPEAHVESHTSGSLILAAVLLKVGVYGVFRFMLPLVPDAILYLYPLIMIVCILAIFLSSLIALKQTDMKKIVAYSSISHMNYIVLGLFSYDLNAIVGAFSYMIAHGFTSIILFYFIGLLYMRFHSRDYTDYSNLINKFPGLYFFLLLYSLANSGFPMFFSFISEILILINIMKINTLLAIFTSFLFFFVIVYSFIIIHNIFFGYDNGKYKIFKSITKIEYFYLFLFFLIILLSGFLGSYIMQYFIQTIIYYLKLSIIS